MMYCNVDCGGDGSRSVFRPEGRYLGHFDSLSQVLRLFPEGGRRGWFFSNSESLSLWMWDPLSGSWHDTLCVDSALQGMVDDPAAFVPRVRRGIRCCYLYVQPAAGTVSFAGFDDGSGGPLRVSVESTSLVLLFWNGDAWEVTVTPFYVDLSSYALADLSNVSRLADVSHDGLLSAADKGKLDLLRPVVVDVDGACRLPVISSRREAVAFLDGLSLLEVASLCRRMPGGSLFGYRMTVDGALCCGSLGFSVSGGDALPLSVSFTGVRLAVCLRESSPGGEVRVRVSSRPADVSVALYRGLSASYAVRRAGYSPLL